LRYLFTSPGTDTTRLGVDFCKGKKMKGRLQIIGEGLKGFNFSGKSGEKERYEGRRKADEGQGIINEKGGGIQRKTFFSQNGGVMRILNQEESERESQEGMCAASLLR